MRLCRNARSIKAMSAFAISVAILVSAGAANAASCSNLKSELVRLQAQSGKKSSAPKKWLTAQRQQKKAISAAERDASYFGCAKNSNAQCKSLNTKIKRMRANLSAIERQLAKGGGTSPKTSKRLRQVRAAIAKRNCNAPPKTRSAKTETRNSADKPRSLLSRLFAPQLNVETVSAKSGDRQITATRRRTGTGRKRLKLPSGRTFRTLCVRTCDGYFFPVSFSTGKSQFANDAARCSEICPASETELYVYKNPGGDQATMMSLAGNIYSEQPFAYRYKTEFVENCSCRQAGQSKRRSAWAEIGGASGSGNRVSFSDISAGLPGQSLHASRGQTFEGSEENESPLARQPLTRGQLPIYEDPDTLANLQKGFNVAAGLSLVNEIARKPTTETVALTASNGLPILASRRRQTEQLDADAISPVFKVDDEGFRPAPDREAPVRVVGPEYFVAQ